MAFLECFAFNKMLFWLQKHMIRLFFMKHTILSYLPHIMLFFALLLCWTAVSLSLCHCVLNRWFRAMFPVLSGQQLLLRVSVYCVPLFTHHIISRLLVVPCHSEPHVCGPRGHADTGNSSGWIDGRRPGGLWERRVDFGEEPSAHRCE